MHRLFTRPTPRSAAALAHHGGKLWSMLQGMNDLRFCAVARSCHLPNVPPSRTLLEVLREDLHCTGTMKAAARATAWACTVVVGEAVDGQLRCAPSMPASGWRIRSTGWR